MDARLSSGRVWSGRFVAPDVRAGVGEAGQLAQFGDMAWRLLGLVVAHRPLELVETDDAKDHAGSLALIVHLA